MATTARPTTTGQRAAGPDPSHAPHPPPVSDRPRSSPRLKGDAYKFVRRVKGDRYQARPYCDIERERYNLGLFRTPDQAVTAIRKFWATSQGDRPKFVRPVRHRDGSTTYRVIVRVGHHRDDLGTFGTQAEAVAAVKGFVERAYGPLAKRVMSRA